MTLGAGTGAVSSGLLDAAEDGFREAALRGLLSFPKEIPGKYLYDDTGWWLFERLRESDEYYPASAEAEIFRERAAEIASKLGRRTVLIENGAGAKTLSLLENLRDPVAYVPVELSRGRLREAALSAERALPGLEVLPVCADFEDFSALPPTRREPGDRAVYLAGTRVGAGSRGAMLDFLRRAWSVCGEGGALVAGFPLKTHPRTIERAYHDGEGHAAAFSKNCVTRLNHELVAGLDPEAFRHEAVYDGRRGCLELRLVSLTDALVRFGDEVAVPVMREESLVTGRVGFYTIDEFRALADTAEWDMSDVWTDSVRRFALAYLRAY